MEEAGIIPDVIDSPPEKTLTVIYPNDKSVNLGNELTPTEVKDTPSVKWEAEDSTYYTLAMVDPDAPSRAEPTYREVNHWLVANVQGNDLSTGDVITGYVGSGPPKGSGLHRYVLLVYKQNQKLEFDEPRTSSTSRENRLNFAIRKFAEKYNLGQPIAGNFYVAQWDPYVEVRNKKISN